MFHLWQNLEDAGDGNAPKNSEEAKEEGERSPEECQPRKDEKEPESDDTDGKEDSPVMGLLTVEKKSGSKIKESEGTENKKHPSESTIKKAVRKRAAYVQANSEYAPFSLNLHYFCYMQMLLFQFTWMFDLAVILINSGSN